MLTSLLPAFANAGPGGAGLPASGTSAPNSFAIVNHLGESDQQAARRDGQLLSDRRATDPFGITIRGPFKGLPPVAEHSPTTPSNAANQVAAAVNVPTLEKAIEGLALGAVNVSSHEILIGPRSVREGDLLVLEFGGRRFVVWVQTVGVRGVLFCNIDLQKHILKPFGSGPKELPENSGSGLSDIRDFLDKDAPH